MFAYQLCTRERTGNRIDDVIAIFSDKRNFVLVSYSSFKLLNSFVVYLYVNGSGSITSVGEERANLSAVVYLSLCSFCFERFPLPLGAWDGLRYFILALPEPFI